MTHSAKLPDAMPEIDTPTLLVVSDAHHCRFIAVGGHTLVEEEELHAPELKHTDRQTVNMGPGGASGVGDEHHAEDHRLREFAIAIAGRASALVERQKVGAVFMAASSRLLSELKKHLPQAVTKALKSTIDGNFVKESATEILARFRPDLEQSVKKLRDLENYSSKKHLPK